MIRIALYDSNKKESRFIARLIYSFAKESGFNNVDVRPFETPSALLDLVKSVRPEHIDCIVLRATDPNDLEEGDFDLLLDKSLRGSTHHERVNNYMQDLREVVAPQTDMILISHDEAHAISAYNAAAGFLHTPFDKDRFTHIIGFRIREKILRRKQSFAVKSNKTFANMDVNDITFVESSRKGPIIHLPSDRFIETRGTLNELHSRLLEKSKMFVRAGGSFIVNLENVRSESDGIVIFADGSTIIVPVRARKQVSDSFANMRMRV